MSSRLAHAQRYVASGAVALRNGVWDHLTNHVAPVFAAADSELASERDKESRAPERVIVGPLFPYPALGGDLMAIADFTKREDNLTWRLELRRKPDSVPPKSLSEANTSFGGVAGLSSLMRSISSGGPTTADCRGQFHLEEAFWHCRLLPRDIIGPSLESPVLRLGDAASQEQVGYRFHNGVNGLAEVAVVYLHDAKCFDVGWRGKAALEVEEDGRIPYLETMNRLVTEVLFNEVADGAK